MKSHTKLIYGFATLLAVCWLVPVYLISISAFSARKSVNAWPKSWWPSEFSLDTLQFFTNFTGVWQAVGNSVIVAIITMVLSIVLGAPAGYALARFDFKGQTVYRLLIVVSWNEVFSASVLTLNNRTLTAFLFAGLEESPLHFRFAGGFFLILPSLVFIFMVRKYLFSMWGISNR